MLRKQIALLGWLIAAGVILAQEKVLSPTELVKQLGDRDFRVRELAGETLLRLGEKALPALEAGTRDPDPEIRRRCQQLYQQLLTACLEGKIKRFLAAQDKDNSATLPGWRLFSELVGCDPASRDLYAQMTRCGYDILEKLERAHQASDAEQRRQAQEECVRYCEAIYQQVMFNNNLPGFGAALSPETFALVAFLTAATSGQKVVAPSGNPYMLCYQQSVRQALMEKTERGQVLRRLLAAWIARDSNPATQIQGMQLALSFDLPELLPVAKQFAENKQLPGYTRAQALAVVAKYGGKPEIHFIERFLGDQSQVTNYPLNKKDRQVICKTELRDWALALLIRLTGQNLRDYPFPVLQAMNVANVDPVRSYLPHYFGFAEPTERDAVFKKWQEWRLQHPQP